MAVASPPVLEPVFETLDGPVEPEVDAEELDNDPVNKVVEDALFVDEGVVGDALFPGDIVVGDELFPGGRVVGDALVPGAEGTVVSGVVSSLDMSVDVLAALTTPGWSAGIAHNT